MAESEESSVNLSGGPYGFLFDLALDYRPPPHPAPLVLWASCWKGRLFALVGAIGDHPRRQPHNALGLCVCEVARTPRSLRRPTIRCSGPLRSGAFARFFAAADRKRYVSSRHMGQRLQNK